MNKNDAKRCWGWCSCSGGGGCSCRAFCPAPHRAGAGRCAGKTDGSGGAAGGSRFLRKRKKKPCPKLPYADGVYVGSSRGYGGTVRVQVTMENGSITEIGILDAFHETRQFLRRAKRL